MYEIAFLNLVLIFFKLNSNLTKTQGAVFFVKSSSNLFSIYQINWVNVLL
ncbi:hypothetical protein EZS27_009034 [termite gut metagenome]|uniref:Uncharacterized protein n=1 Tax=termite gut metagenome TaxID=433724 RepID=A0A5J4SBK8_9ZZZZ